MEKAFTLIELLVVIAIIGILAGMAVVNMSGARDAAKMAKSKAFSGSIRSALLMNRISEWMFNEGSGTVVADTIGVSNGTLTSGPVWKSGSDCVDGGCLQFDGTDDYINIPNSSAMPSGSSPRTITAWIKESSFAQRGMIVSYGENADLKQWDFEVNGWVSPLNGKLEVHI